jgi:HPt (histidine-containing phosphotransfer) domain-containing protein
MSALEVDSHGGSPTLDLAQLSNIAAGRLDLMRRVLQAYLDSSPDTIKNLTTAQTTGDKTAIGFAAHSLKGSSRTIGALKLGDLCQALEASPDANHVRRVVEEYGQVVVEIQAYMARTA